MQTQLTDLREKLTSAFGEITNLVKQKTANDQATWAAEEEAKKLRWFRSCERGLSQAKR